MSLPADVLTLISKLNSAGHKAYTVGGCVRDALLGKEPNDWDITTSASPEEVRCALDGYHIIDTGIKHGTVTVVLDELYEITTFRIDGTYSDGRHPDSVSFSKDIKDDLSRRDFTINAMAYHPEEGLIDVYGGVSDLEKGLIRCVGSPLSRFEEDALRLLRAVRFQAKLGFEIEESTKSAMWILRNRLNMVSQERIGAELLKTVCSPYASRAISENLSLISVVIPELGACFGCSQNSPYHFADVFRHTMLALEKASDDSGFFPSEWADERVKLAVFFHDIAKPLCKHTDKNGADHFKGHPALGADMAEKIMRRLKYSNKLISDVSELILYHDTVLHSDQPCVRRWFAKLGSEQLHRLLKVKECDISAHTELAKPRMDQTTAFWHCLEETEASEPIINLKELKIGGKDLIALGYKPGKDLGRALETILDEVIDNKTENERSALLERAKELLAKTAK